MIRAALIILLLASCAWAESVTVTISETQVTSRQPDRSPRTISALALLARTTGVPAGHEFDFCDALAPLSIIDPPLYPVLILPGSSWRLVMSEEADSVENYSTYAFRSFFSPSPGTEVPAVVSGGSGSIAIEITATNSLHLQGYKGWLHVFVIDQSGVGRGHQMSIPVEAYPTVSRQP